MSRASRFLLSVCLAMAWAWHPAEAQEKRQIHIINDDGQEYNFSKVYELKNVKGQDIYPYVTNALMQTGYSSTSKTLVYKEEKREFISLTMPQLLIPYMDELVKVLDRPCGKPGPNGNLVMGSGIYDFAYVPKNRNSIAMLRMVRVIGGSSEGDYFLDGYTNNIYWKDSLSDGMSSLENLRTLDVPIPQVNVSLNVYELSDSMLRELGIDWLQWKNGPGADFFSVGADMFNFQQNVNTMPGMQDFAGRIGNAWGGFLFAPQIDFTYVKLLAQKGRSRVFTSGLVTVLNQNESKYAGEDIFGDAAGSAGLFNYQISVTTNNQFIQKDVNQETSVRSNPTTLTISLVNPVITHPALNSDTPVILSCDYKLNGTNRVNISENATDKPIVNAFGVSSNLYLISGSEKVVGTFTKNFDVKQKNGIPWLSELPVLEYIFGVVNEVKSKSMLIVTVEAQNINVDNDVAHPSAPQKGDVYKDVLEWDNTFNPNSF